MITLEHASALLSSTDQTDSCLIHVMNIFFSSNTLSRCVPENIPVSHIHHLQGVSAKVVLESFIFCKSANESVYIIGKTQKLCEVKFILMKISVMHTSFVELYHAEQLKFLIPHLSQSV